MVYHPGDARSALRTAPTASPSTGTDSPRQAAEADYVRFYEVPPTTRDDNARTWYARSQHLVTGYTQVTGETVVEHPGGPDEHALLLPEDTVGATIESGGESTEVSGHTLTFMPPGPATLTLRGTGRAVTIATTRSEALAARAANADSYEQPHPHVAPLIPWPEPVGGYRVRTYRLDVPGLENPPFRIFRCSSFMVNAPRPRSGPRDTTKMSPHSHDDFEQCSLIIDGEFVHHLRWPWTTDLGQWREDDHEHCGAPSLTVIPPPVVHTSQAVGKETNHLIDLFAPPRRDFSLMPGWVLNADEYPMPDDPEPAR
ncbi:hypothetical protein [Streptomyces sp. NPDC058665]|uniref:hypothetical protein n=1 Tax=Streptomyces sp. NPDC058665 TaxID=3346586 RepID=UPI003664102C